MIVELDVESLKGRLQLSCCRNIFPRGFDIATWMIVGKDNGGGKEFECSCRNVSGVEGYMVNRPLSAIRFDKPILPIHVDDDQLFTLSVPQPRS